MVTPSAQARTGGRHTRRKEEDGEEEDDDDEEDDEEEEESDEEEDDDDMSSEGKSSKKGGGKGKGGSGGSVKSKGSTKKSGKSRRELPPGAVAILKQWLLSAEHFTHPYPTAQDQANLMAATGIDKKQLKNWFTNARRRIWKPMMKKQLEQASKGALGFHHHHHGHPQVMEQALAGHHYPRGQPYHHTAPHAMAPPMVPPAHMGHLQMEDFFKPPAFGTEAGVPTTNGNGTNVNNTSGSPVIPQPSMHPLMKTFSSKSFSNFRTASFTDFPRTDSYAFLEVFFNDEGLEGLSNEPLDSIGLCMDEPGNDNSPTTEGGSSSTGLGAASMKRGLDKVSGNNMNGGGDGGETNGAPPGKRVSGHITFAAPAHGIGSSEGAGQSQPPQPGAGPFGQPMVYYQPFKAFASHPGQLQQVNNNNNNGASPFSTGFMGETGNQNTSSAQPAQQQQPQQQQQQPMSGGAVHVSSASRCPFCPELNVDTQLRPCGHLFHGNCLKPWLQESAGAPVCPVCEAPISSCVLAIPCIYPPAQMLGQQQQQQQQGSQPPQQQGATTVVKAELVPPATLTPASLPNGRYFNT